MSVVFGAKAISPLFDLPVFDDMPDSYLAQECPVSPATRELTDDPVIDEHAVLISQGHTVAQQLPSLPTLEKDAEYYPKTSLVVMDAQRQRGEKIPPLPSLQQAYYSKSEREQWARDNLSPRILAKLNDPHGKESIDQCFKAEATLRHCLLPMLRRGFLEMGSPESQVLPVVCRDFRNLFVMLQEYREVDFNPLRGFPLDWKTQVVVDPDRVKMASAALLFFEGDAGALSAFMGGARGHGIGMFLLLLLSWPTKWTQHWLLNSSGYLQMAFPNIAMLMPRKPISRHTTSMGIIQRLMTS